MKMVTSSAAKSCTSIILNVNKIMSVMFKKKAEF